MSCLRICLVLAVFSLLIVGCGGPPALNWETIDQHQYNVAVGDGGFELPSERLYELIYFSRVASAGGPADAETILRFRDSILVDTLIGLESASYNLRNHWHENWEYRDRRNAALRQMFWDRRVATKITLDSAKVVAYYESHPEQFTVPEQADLYHILSSPIGFAHHRDSVLVRGMSRDQLTVAAEEHINHLYSLLELGEAFENVARDWSHDVTTRESGGHLGWVVPEKYVDPFDSVAFSLEDGQYSQPYLDADGWHLLYRAAYVPRGPLPLDSPRVWVGAQQAVFDAEAAEMASAILDSLYPTTELEINDIILTDTNIYLVADSVWAAVVNAQDTISVYRLKGLEDDFRRAYRVDSTNAEQHRSMVKQAAAPFRVLHAARASGFDTLPFFVEYERDLRHGIVRRVIMAELVKLDWEAPDSTVRQYYDEHLEEYRPTKHLKVEQLVVQDAELAQFLREQAATGVDLAELAEYYRKDGHQIKYEDLGVIEKGEVDTAFYTAAEHTRLNKISRVVSSSDGFHLIKVLARKNNKPFSMARNEIKRILANEHRQRKWDRFRDDLYAKYHITFPADLPPFELPRLSQRNHPRVNTERK